MRFKIRNILALGCAFTLFNTGIVSAASIGTITGDGVNLRASNSVDSSVVTVLSSGAQLSILNDLDGWFEVASPTGGIAYVTSDYIKITQSDATINSSSVNIRTEPSADAAIIGQLSEGDSLNVQGISGDWYAVLYNGTKAYVHKDYVTGNLLKYFPISSAADTLHQSGDVYAIITSSDGLNLRVGASTSSDIIKTLSNGSTVDVLDVTNEWAQVKDNSGSVGYVSTDYITLKNGKRPSEAASSEKGEQIVAFAKQFIGTPYVYGGTSLTSGVDCSGFTYSVFKNFGINLNRVSRDQIKNGTPVNKSDLVAGDLVFFNTGGNTPISHVGMYIGNGQYIHSTDGGNAGVTITNLNSGYSARTYYGACRVLK